MARDFSADTDVVDFGDIFDFLSTQAWTVLVIAKSDLVNTANIITSKWVNGADRRQYAMEFRTNNRLRLWHNASDQAIQSLSAVEANKWYCVAQMCDGAANLKQYCIRLEDLVFTVDGDTGTTAGDQADLTDPFVAGIDSSQAESHPSGSVAFLCVVNAEVTREEIRQFAFNPVRAAAQLKGRYGLTVFAPLNGASPEPDWSGSGNNGTVTGTTVADNPPVAPLFGFDMGWMGAFAAAPAGAIDPAVALYHQRHHNKAA